MDYNPRFYRNEPAPGLLRALQAPQSDELTPEGQRYSEAITAGASGPRTLMLSIVDLPLADTAEPLYRFRISPAMNFTASGSGTADAEIAATSPASLRLYKNGAANGTIDYVGATGTINLTDPSYAEGDLFELYPPASTDATLDQLSITFQL